MERPRARGEAKGSRPAPPGSPASSTGWGRLGTPLTLAVALLACAVAAFHAFVQIELIDEGVLNMGAWRIAEGQVPYRDFFVFYTPGSFYLVALVYKLFGAALLPGRVLAALLGAGIVAAAAALARRLLGASLFAAVPVAVLCQAGLGGWPFASHHWIADLLCLLSVLLLDRLWAGSAAGTSRGHFLLPLLAGACAAAAFWTLTGQGALLILLVSLLFLPRLPAEARIRSALGWLAGIVAASLPFLFLFSRVDGATLRYDLLVFPTTAYKSIEGNRYGFTFPFRELIAQWTSGAWRTAPVYTPVVTLTSVYLCLAPVAAVAVLALAWWKRWEAPARRGLIAALALTFVLTAAWRWGPINLQWTAVPPALVVAWGLARWHRAAPPRARRLPVAIAVLIAASFCFVGLYRIGKVLAPGIPYPVRAPAGTWYTFNRRQAVQLQELIDQIGARLEPGEPLLCKTAPLVGFMTRHPNPTRFDLFAPPDYTPAQQVEEAIRTIDLGRLRFIMTPAFIPSENPFDSYLTSRYTLVWDNGEYGLWRRNGS